jgi:hypothetical protein
MREELFHRIIVTGEAEVDYTESLGGSRLNKAELNAELSEYISVRQRRGCFQGDYFRAKYFDGGLNRMLMLFVYRAERLRNMQFWEVRGVCFAEDWNEDDEYYGRVRFWLDTKTEGLPETLDWVIRYRMNEIRKVSEKTLEKNIAAEVLNGFECGRDKEIVEGLLFLQNASGKRRRRTKRKVRKP